VRRVEEKFHLTAHMAAGVSRTEWASAVIRVQHAQAVGTVIASRGGIWTRSDRSALQAQFTGSGQSTRVDLPEMIINLGRISENSQKNQN
jgi:hypothetical protein